MKNVLVMCIFAAFMMCGCEPTQKETEGTESMGEETMGMKFAVIETDKGVIKFELFEKEAPKHVANFIKLAGKKFYDGLTFHRVEPGFVIQGGDPLGNGTGGPGYTIPAEFSGKKHLLGSIAAARLGDQVNPQKASSGSQFYICLGPQSFLDNNYTVFGQVVEGLDVIGKIKVGDKMIKVYVTGK